MKTSGAETGPMLGSGAPRWRVLSRRFARKLDWLESNGIRHVLWLRDEDQMPARTFDKLIE